jgi:hypothetical protein
LASAQDAGSISTLAARHSERAEPLAEFIKPSFLQGRQRRPLIAIRANEGVDVFYNVDGEKTAQLLRKYYDLSALPLKERKTLFRRASPADKSGLWQAHLALVLVRYPQLNAWQKEIILSTILLLTPEHYDVPSSSPEWKTKVREPARLLEQQISVAFSPEDAAMIFTTLGFNTEAATHGPTRVDPISLTNINQYQPVSESNPYQQWLRSRFSAQDVELEQSATCGCNTSWDFCPAWRYCSAGACTPPAQDGCGLGWSFPCNGVCR